MQIFNVGYSRAYLCRDKNLTQLSEDHSQVQQVVRLGIIKQDEAKFHSDSHMLTQHLGILPNEMIIEPNISEKISLEPDDLFLLCSDGLTDILDDREIARLLGFDLPVMAKATLLRDTVLGKWGKDNITVLLAHVSIRGKTGYGHKLLQAI